MQERQQSIEALRIAAAFGIVYYHSFASPGHKIAYAGLIAFLILSGYFAARRPANTRTLQDTTTRLFFPWAVWFAIYAALNWHMRVPLVAPGLAGILTGPSVHLWYLPWAWLCVLATRFARRRLGLSTCGTIATTIAVAVVISIPAWRPASLAAGDPWAEYMHATAPFCWGVVIAQQSSTRRTTQIAVLCASLLSPLMFDDGLMLLMPYMIGLATCLITMNVVNASWPRRLRVGRLAEATYGIYLGHILAFRILLHGMREHTPFMAVAAFFLSAGGALIWPVFLRSVSTRVIARARISR